MAASGLLHFSPELGTGKSPFLGKRFKNCGRAKLNLQATNLSSLGSLQEPWNLYLANSLKRPIYLFSYRRRPVSCHSSLLPIQKIADSCIKGASAILTRYNSLRGKPATIKLVSAVGIIAFALWGLGPLVRSCRNNILHNSDNNWNRSNTHYALTSYLQPVFLWIGAMLVCRGLDPIIMPSEASNLVKQRLLSFVRSLSTVLAFAYSLSCAIKQAQKIALEKSGPSDSRNMGFQFAGKAVHSAVWVAAISLFMELLGFSTQRWATAGGLGTVLITLAGREIFTNFLSSMMIHATRPFVVNEWIQTKIGGYDVSGTVEHVGWWSSTMIRSEDLEAVHIPSHKFTVNVVRNLTQRSHWRIKTHIAVCHLDVNKINNIVADMRKVLAKNPQVEQKRLHRRVFLENVNPENQALLILVSCFVKTSYYEEYLCVKEAILLDLLRVISHHQARLATPIRTIQKIYRDTNLDNVSFSESAFSRGGESATNRPYLIVEPSYKISGEERSKSSSRSAQSSKSSSGGDQVTQITGQQPSSVSSSETSSGSSPSSETESEQGKKPPVLLSAKPRPALEENIVLGVALDGSKRTLPIDEHRPDYDPSPAVKPEPEVVAKSKNGDGKGSGKKGVEMGEKET